MSTRLALAIHMANSKFSLSNEPLKFLCSDKDTPECLSTAIRSQHLGCDFHVDSDLSGVNSRLFECNIGPDMFVHNVPDGKLKLEIAADFVSFLGFTGPFDDSLENAKKNRLFKIYDSHDFSVETAFAILRGKVEPTNKQVVQPEL